MTTISSEVSSPQTESTDSTKPSAPSIRTVPDRTLTKNRADFRPKTSIPQDLTAEEYASQCIQAAIASRLSPYHLHRGEYELLRHYINHVHITIYLHIRNGILRLWQRNPLVSVTREEAAGCAKDYRFFDVAEVAYDWLVRNGYINFGCIEVPNTIIGPVSPIKRQKTVVVIGAGMAGLGCARQLEGLFSQLGDKLQPDEHPPRVVVLEGRGRIGGRVYSHPLKDQSGSTLPPTKRVTADLGAQVITGFENGNPLNILVRGQLALEYHSLKDNEVLFDSDGSMVDKECDRLVEKLFNHMLDRPEITGEETISLEPQGSNLQFPTLGKTMDAAVQKYQDFLSLTPLDLRLMNWHYANLEYANASTVDSLSLGHWDQDDGQEPAGPHSVLLGGYMQVPRGLLLAPKLLDIKPRHIVKKIVSGLGKDDLSKIECENGVVIEADAIVVTLPLGVLKAENVEFEPPLPDWKTGAIRRMGYGLLNKVVLVFDEPFWDADNDMVGVLRDPVGDPLQQQSYEANRGRFYMFWNAMKQSGKPVLVSLMAGEAAVQTEFDTDENIIEEATAALQKMYPDKVVPPPTETIITRWRKDPFSRGSYSYVGQEATAEDYDLMAKPVGNNLYFAGEATCKSHPATVHGAYISGLRAAAEVVTSILGPIQPPCHPLVPPKPKLETSYSGATSRKRKAEESAIEKSRELKTQRLESHEQAMNDALIATLGERPSKPGRSGANPFLLYQKDHWFICKGKCDEARRKATNNPEAKATRNEVRAALGQMWRDAPENEKRPYLAETEKNKESNAAGIVDFKKKIKDWDVAAAKFKKEWKEKNVSVPSEEEKQATRQAELEKQEIKRSRKMNGYADSEDEDY
ncbi:flavin-containing amine oxidoreductase-domain containing protein [Tricharina praecox]|uniref:flavin-containing amine oxidoreductase-domain containing protein n=1 Tax=Tricharina praecox TaxID=43433 RepID=UPI00221E4B25|nr:flavin-containing amine oxidoreductase-domain containing protein [Tricharina praecox]KAI5846870.1 flavin-containing amine oxidoreductase-domain containing protein [Tricharina praecox]